MIAAADTTDRQPQARDDVMSFLRISLGILLAIFIDAAILGTLHPRCTKESIGTAECPIDEDFK